LYDVPDKFKTEELCKIVVALHGKTLSDFPDEIKSYEICSIAVQRDGKALAHVPEYLKTPELCLLAAYQNGKSLAYAPLHRVTKKLCKIAVSSNGKALEFVPRKFKTPRICRVAVARTSDAMQYVPDHLRAEITTFGETFAKGMKYILASEVENPLDTSDKDYLEYIYETYFDKTKKYAFIMRSTQEERIVCKPYVFGEEFDEEDESPIALVGVFDENNTVDFNYELKIESMVFPKPEELDSEEFETVEKLSEYVFNDINWAEHQGVIAFYQNGRELKSWKIVPVEYAQRFEIRNNVPSLRFRYLQLRNFRRNHPAKMELFLIMYPEFDHEQMETSIYNLCLYLHDLYMKKYIQKTLTIPLSDDESKILAIIHGIYKQDTFVITTPEKINNILAFGSPTTLNHLLKERAFKEKKPINN